MRESSRRIKQPTKEETTTNSRKQRTKNESEDICSQSRG